MLKREDIMKNNKSDIFKSAKAALFSCLSEVSFLKVIDASDLMYGDHVQADLIVRLEFPDTKMLLIAEVKGNGQPRQAREAVNQILRYRSKISDAYFVFIAPYISQRAAEICRAENIGYLDLSGNCLLSFDKIFIEKKDYPNQFKEKRVLKSLYSPKAERILRVLLCNPGSEWNIKALAVESGVSLGQVSNVKRILEDREMLTGRRGGFLLNQPEPVLKEWSENYNYRKNNIQEFYSLMNITDIEKAVAAYCRKNRMKYALTGFSGAARMEPAVRYNRAMIYADNLSAKDFSKLSVKAVGSGGNLLLFAPYDEGVFYGPTEIDGIRIVSTIQLYLDLIGFRGRGEEAADILLERVIKKEW